MIFCSTFSIKFWIIKNDYEKYNLKYIQRDLKITAMCVYKQVQTFNSQIGSQTIYILLHSLSSVSAFAYLAQSCPKSSFMWKLFSDVLTANIHFKDMLKGHLIWETFPNPPINCTLLDFSSHSALVLFLIFNITT